MNDIQSKKTPDVIAAEQELDTLQRLAAGVSTTIADLMGKRPTFDGSSVELSLQDMRYSTLKGYQELAHRCYGKTVLGKEFDIDSHPKGNFQYRISQANVGNTDCAILARNSPLASKLVTVRPGEEAEVKVPRGLRFFSAEEVRNFEGPVSLLSPTQPPNFQLMEVLLQNADPLVVRNLRAFIQRHAKSAKTDELPSQKQPPGQPIPISAIGFGQSNDSGWISDWGDVYLGDTETLSLSSRFFTQTTPEQEEILNNPRGVTFVEGVAGAGKTSVALGRLKFFANFSTGEQLEHYGLKNQPAGDFSPTRMVGFVLSHSLKRYLKDTAANLELERLPVRDFHEFRTYLSNRFGLTRKFKRSKTDAPSCRTQLRWLVAIDSAAARIVGLRLRDFLSKYSDIPGPVRTTINDIANELAAAEPRPDTFHLQGLANYIVREVQTVEFRTREMIIRDKINRETNAPKKIDLERTLSQVRREEEHNGISAVGDRLLKILEPADLFINAINSRELETILVKAFECSGDDAKIRKLNDAIESLRQLVSQSSDGTEPALTDSDLISAIAIAAMIADGFEYQADVGLYQIRHNTGIFIDEVQDFSELEIFLMGMTVTDTYGQITLSGDRRQRLQENGTENYKHLFPLIPRRLQNPDVFLDRNFRQREELATFTARFRALVQGDNRVDIAESDPTIPVYPFDSLEKMDQLILHCIRSVDANATIAIICRTEGDARAWYQLLQDPLAAYHRPALLSRREDLTRRFDVHFTEVLETKGLEFDVVIIPDLASFSLESAIGRNQLYVAISRPKHALLLGSSDTTFQHPTLKTLIEKKLLRIADIRARLRQQ